MNLMSKKHTKTKRFTVFCDYDLGLLRDYFEMTQICTNPEPNKLFTSQIITPYNKNANNIFLPLFSEQLPTNNS